ncbi:hypothetical protein SODALDRAFT_380260 [Sodiomyces alkalinus F11]|uniref:Uncharacterized protein n=1 Tax=Sodiomyces alkalinus (strain CBS 110278 / VKM F-3762 / F11) TaxID=1314773 RepID=A0A3N2PQM1_SODAK|nr:hypothetical protein SODALDRAFT_380260 [Sodiomyces alkalinus F11]ROT36768.1 hypothetical protein SODALDRAFT_380260 [Sodiomyces alkalinus F11]
MPSAQDGSTKKLVVSLGCIQGAVRSRRVSANPYWTACTSRTRVSSGGRPSSVLLPESYQSPHLVLPTNRQMASRVVIQNTRSLVESSRIDDYQASPPRTVKSITTGSHHSHSAIYVRCTILRDPDYRDSFQWGNPQSNDKLKASRELNPFSQSIAPVNPTSREDVTGRRHEAKVLGLHHPFPRGGSMRFKGPEES